MEWISVKDRLPDAGVKVLATYKNRLGKVRRVCAEYVPRFYKEEMEFDELDSEYNEEEDIYYWPEGWYESIDNWDDFHLIAITEGSVTQWVPLPAPPTMTENPDRTEGD